MAPSEDRKDFEGRSERPDEETLHVARGGHGPEPPRELGEFRIGEFLGKGAMGRVHKAVHGKTGATAVVKFVAASERPAVIDSLRAEVIRLAELNVPHIPKVLDTGIEQGFVWFAQEFIDGTDLREVIRRRRDGESSFHVDFENGGSDGDHEVGTPPPGLGAEGEEIHRAMRWFRDLALALEAVHQAGLLHRDIKPANIVLAHGRVPYLIDFGLAIHASESAAVVGKPAGTLPYMSPEQASLGWGGIGPPSDIYSLAVTFHELLTCERVVKSHDREAIVTEILRDEVPRPSKIRRQLPKSLDPIFLRATAKRVEDRYASAGELAADLEGWLRPTSIGLRFRYWYMDHRPTALIAALLVVVLACWKLGFCDPRPDERRLTIDRLQSLLADPAACAAGLEELPATIRKYAGDAEIAELIDRVVATGAERRTEDLMAGFCLMVMKSGAEDEAERLVKDAAQLAALGHDHRDLRLHAAFEHLMDRRLAEARAELDAGLALPGDEGARRRLLGLALAVARIQGDDETAAALESDLGPVHRGRDRAPDADVLVCFEALGWLLAPDARRYPVRGRELLERLAAAFETEWARSSRSLHALIALDLDQFETAISDLRFLVHDPGGTDQAIGEARRAGASAFLVLADLLAAASADDEVTRAEHRREADEAARALLRARPGILNGLARHIRKRLQARGLGPNEVAAPTLNDQLVGFLGDLPLGTWDQVRPDQEILWLLAKILLPAAYYGRDQGLDRFEPIFDLLPPDESCREHWIYYRENIAWARLKALLSAVYREREAGNGGPGPETTASFAAARAFGSRYAQAGRPEYERSATFRVFARLVAIEAALLPGAAEAEVAQARADLDGLQAEAAGLPRGDRGLVAWLNLLQKEFAP